MSNKPDFWADAKIVNEGGKPTIKRSDLLCDFCCGRGMPLYWSYPVGFMELPITTNPTGLPSVTDDDWAACTTCHDLIEAEEWETLAVRSIKTQLSQWQNDMTPWDQVPPETQKKAIAEVVEHFKRFQAARKGPAEYKGGLGWTPLDEE